MTRGLLIGADVGTSALKAVLVDPAAGVLAVANQPYPMHRPHPGWAENDPEDWHAALVAAVRGLLADAGVAGVDVAALCIAGQRDQVVLLDGDDQVLAPAIHWSDRRDPAGTAAVFERVGAARILEISGVVPTPGLALTGIDWTQRHQPEAWRATRRAVAPKDFLVRRLTGVDGTDTSTPSRSLLNDWRADAWSDELCGAAGIDPSVLPPIRFGAWEPVGQLRPEAAAALGLPATTIVAAGGGDDQAAALGCGVVGPGSVSLGAGSSMAWRVVAPEPAVDALGRMCIARHVVPGQRIYELIAVGSGTMLAWFRATLAAGAGPAPSYDELIAEAAAVPPGSDGLLFYPYPDGATLPEDHPAARGTFLGVTARHTRAHFTRAILEGVAYLYPMLLDMLAERGVEADRLLLIDGESRSAVWNQVKADVSGRTLQTPTVAEASALGAAILAGTAAGAFASAAAGVEALVHTRDTFEPRADRHAAYRELQAAWARAGTHVFRAYDALADLAG